jgi:hypothetical protein
MSEAYLAMPIPRASIQPKWLPGKHFSARW